MNETAAPVYLVLENRSGNRSGIFTPQTGCESNGSFLLGHEAGVANLDDVVPVEVILSSGLADCDIVPAYAPTARQMQMRTRRRQPADARSGYRGAFPGRIL